MGYDKSGEDELMATKKVPADPARVEAIVMVISAQKTLRLEEASRAVERVKRMIQSKANGTFHRVPPTLVTWSLVCVAPHAPPVRS